MKYFCYQGNNGDCGFASLKMMMASYSHNRSYLFIKKGKKKKDFTFLDLEHIAKQYDFNIKAYRIPDKSLKDLETPFLAKYNSNHLVMVNRIKNDKVEIFDPGSGIQKMSVDEFKIKWTGECLEREENSIPKIISVKPPILMPKKHQFIQAIFICLIAAILLAGLFFIKENSSFILVIGLLALFVIFELVENWYLIKRINSFDKTYIPLYFDEENSNYESYKNYIDFKKDYFKSRKSVLASVLLVICLTVLMSINDPKNVIAFAVVFIAQILDKILFRNKQKRKEAEINDIESKAFDNKDSATKNLLIANSLASSFGLFVSARKTVIAFLIAVLSILMMVFNHMISTSYVLFQFGAYYVTSNAFESTIDYFMSYEKSKKSYSQFIDKCNL